MLSRRTALQTVLGTIAAVLGGRARTATAQISGRPVTSTEILRHDLPNVTGKQVVIVSIEYAPGAGSPRHRHPGPAFGYVARGTIVSEIGTAPPTTYTEGETWYEPPESVLSISRNASGTEPARLIVFFVADRKEVLTVPI